MRSILLALAVIGILTGIEPASAEITYPWCAEYAGGRGGGRNCGFWTYEQCYTAMWGNGGYCDHNPMYRPSPGQISPPAGPRRRPG